MSLTASRIDESHTFTIDIYQLSLAAFIDSMPRLSVTISEDHRRLEQDFQFIRTSTTDERKTHWAGELTLELARHCISEDQILLPAFREKLADGNQRCEQLTRDHKSIREKLRKLRLIPLEDINFEPELQALWVDLSRHIRDIDSHDLTRLEDCLSSPESESLADRFRLSRKLAPTRSRPPGAPGPPADTVKEFLATSSGSLEEMDSTLGTGS
ncbi:hhe domain protein [Verticillium dahliae]